MRWIPIRLGAIALGAGMFTAAAIVTLGAAPEAVAAQDERRTCRCVDADGNEIENCECLRTPRLDRLLPQIAVLRDSRPRLGVTIDMDVDATEEGARVSDVLEGGPADEAGLREGDVIVGIDGRSLRDPLGDEGERDFDLDRSVPAQRLLALARDLEPGESVEVEYLRDGRRQTTVLEAADLSDRWGRLEVLGQGFDGEQLRGRIQELTDGARWRMRSGPDGGSTYLFDRPGGDVRVFGGPGGEARVFGPDGAFFFGDGASGLRLTELNEGLGAYFGATEGVLVLDAENENLGLRAGDVVVSIGGRAVTTPERMRRILGSYVDDEDVEMRIIRNGDEITVTGRRRY